MKIGQLLDKKHSLLEGLRFGQKEMSLVKSKHANDVMVGIEYEMHISDYWRNNAEQMPYYRDDFEEEEEEFSEEEIQEMQARLAQRERAALEEQYRDEVHVHLENENMEILADLGFQSHIISRLIERLLVINSSDADTWFPHLANEIILNARALVSMKPDIEEYITDLRFTDYAVYVFGFEVTAESLEGVIQDFDKFTKSKYGGVIDMEEFDDSAFFDHDDAENLPQFDFATPDMFNTADNIMHQFEEYVHEYISPMVQHISISASSQERAFELVRNMINDFIDNEVDDRLNEIDMDDFRDDAIEELEREEEAGNRSFRRDEIPGPFDYVGLLTGMLKSDGLYGDGKIKTVVTDPSVEPGAEAIYAVSPINDAMDFMEKMHEFMEKWDCTTTDRAGMHVNMSIKGKAMDRNHINVVKLMMLVDNEYMMRNYPVRNYVESVFNHESFMLYHIARNVWHKTNNPDNLLDVAQAMEEAISGTLDFEKYRGVNFLNILGQHNVEQGPGGRRIEFRYFGGKDYEKRTKQMTFDIYRIAYILLAAFDEDFARKEYLQSLYGYVNDKFEDMFDMSFIDFYRNAEPFFEREIVPSFAHSPRDAKFARDFFDAEKNPERSEFAGRKFLNSLLKRSKRELAESLGAFIDDVTDSVETMGRSHASISPAIRRAMNVSSVISMTYQMLDRFGGSILDGKLTAKQVADKIEAHMDYSHELAKVVFWYWYDKYGKKYDIVRNYLSASQTSLTTGIIDQLPELLDENSARLKELAAVHAAKRL